MSQDTTNRLEAARAWRDHDPDETTQEELGELIGKAEAGDDGAAKELAERFSGPLAFGTAGLRGVLGAGESRMNRAVVRRTSHGLAGYLKERLGDEAVRRGVVVAYDGRRLGPEFAEDTARVLAAQGLKVWLSPALCPTPLCAFAVRELGAAAGVMVTASHNPPEYNGYKAYWGNGAQIVPPHDTGIAEHIDRAPAADEVPMVDTTTAKADGTIVMWPAAVEAKYLDAVMALRVGDTGTSKRDMPIVYTPLHGVGFKHVDECLRRAGFSKVHCVDEQKEPNGEFPTVRFPNPEEPGALDLSYALADKVGASLIVANDPDVDRLAVAVRPRSAGGKGAFTQLTGNQIGVLLGHYVLSSGPQTHNRLTLASCVSSPMLGAISAQMGVAYEETLTGFKWIANRAMALDAERGLSFVFGYEEALGYTVGPLVRDKDGISAALLLCELAASLAGEGRDLLDRWEELVRTYGFYASRQVSITKAGTEGKAEIAEIMDGLRDKTPKVLGPRKVVSVSDVERGKKRAQDGRETRLELPPSNVLILELEDRCRVIARPSGTEPKIKFYYDVALDLAEGETLEDAQKRADELIDQLAGAMDAAQSS